MISEKIKSYMIEYYSKAEDLIKGSNFEDSYKQAYQAYQLSLLLKDSEYLYLSALMIKNLCSHISKMSYNQGKCLYEIERFSDAEQQLKKAKKFAKIGIKFERPFKEIEHQKFLKIIENLISKNHAEIVIIRKNKIEKVKESVVDKVEDVRYFIKNLRSDYSYESDEQDADDTTKDVEYYSYSTISEYEKEILEDAINNYNAGIKVLNNTSYINAEIHYISAINFFKDCHRLSKKHFPDLDNDALEKIAESYYNLAANFENEGDSYFDSRDYSLAQDKYFEAQNYYEKGLEYATYHFDDFKEAILRTENKHNEANYYDTYED